MTIQFCSFFEFSHHSLAEGGEINVSVGCDEPLAHDSKHFLIPIFGGHAIKAFVCDRHFNMLTELLTAVEEVRSVED